MYKFKEYHSNKALTDVFVEPIDIWVRIDENLGYCIVFEDSANNKYDLYTKDRLLYYKLVDVIINKSVFDSNELVVMNESHFSEDCSDMRNYVMDNYNICKED